MAKLNAEGVLMACGVGNVEKLGHHVAKGGSLTLVSSYGDTTYHYSADNNQPGCIQFLLDQGARNIDSVAAGEGAWRAGFGGSPGGAPCLPRTRATRRVRIALSAAALPVDDTLASRWGRQAVRPHQRCASGVDLPIRGVVRRDELGVAVAALASTRAR